MGPGLVYLTEPNRTKDSFDGENEKLIYGATGMQGWRLSMEDAHLCILKVGGKSNVSLFGVFDGHGGQEVAKFVGRHFEAELVGNANFKAGSYEQSLIDNYLKMDELLETAAGRREMRDLQSESGGDNGYEEGSYVADMKGCTATVVLIVDDYMYFANAGDTRAIVGKKGKAQQITNDHKPDLPTEKNRIIKAGGSVTEGRVEGNLNLSRALGDMQYKKDKTQKPEHHMITAYPEVSKLKITKDLDFLVIGCDGVWEEKTNQQILDFIYKKYEGGAKSPKLSEIVEPLLDSLVSPDYVQTSGIGCDNMTCICVKFK